MKTKRVGKYVQPHAKRSEDEALPTKLRLLVVKGIVLGVEVYRGFARLCDLANVSAADVFDQKDNPLGTQRDLSPKHAKKAYVYVKSHEFAFWPEVFLCVRNPKAVAFKRVPRNESIGHITIDTETVRKDKRIAISRVDGNHRLHYAAGDQPGYPAITKQVSFCLAYNLNLEQEIKLFRDINDNQRRMNTSHLDNIAARLTPEEIQKRQDPPLYIAKALGLDADSAFHDMIFEGGRKPGYFMVPLRSLKSGIRYMLSQPTKLSALPDVDAQYRVIRNYFCAVKKWQPQGWAEPRKYLLLRGAGLWAICFIGAEVMDRALTAGKYSVDRMLHILQSGTKWNWSKGGDFAGLGGRQGAVQIRNKVVGEFADESGVSLKKLAREIMR